MVSKGDFVGFTIGDYHSSELGIMRVSGGSRYSENLLPSITDKTIPIPGGDGSYFFGSYYSQKPESISYAFDSMTEKNLRDLKRILGKKEPQKFIYDESPYKYYMVKMASSPTIKDICFDENNQRIYKGEGTFQIVSYFPYARSVHKFLNEYDCANIDEWKEASGMKQNNDLGYDTFAKSETTYTANLYNAGDLETGCIITIPFSNTNVIGVNPKERINITFEQDKKQKTLLLSQIQKKGQDTHIKINTDTELIEGYVIVDGQFVRTGNIYNDYKYGGEFFKISDGEGKLIITNLGTDPKIDYDYIYY